MKEYQKYLTELFGLGNRNKNPLMEQVQSWMKENLGIEMFRPHKDENIGTFGFNATGPTGIRYWLQPNEDGSEIIIVVNENAYDVKVRSIEDLERFATDKDLVAFHKI